MKILLQSRHDLLDLPAGDTLQILKTKVFLEKNGFKADISLKRDADLSDYGAVHIFNTARLYETEAFFNNAKKQDKKIVLTPIIQDLKEYNKKGRFGALKDVYRLIGEEKAEYIKNMIMNFQLRQPLGILTDPNLGRKRKKIFENCEAICFSSQKEMQEANRRYDIKCRQYIARLGVDSHEPESPEEGFQGLKDPILCVGKIEPIKNQLNLIKAMKGENIPLIFIGAPNKLHRAYIREFLDQVRADKKIYFLPPFSNKRLAFFYRLAKVHVNCSWFENVGLVNLEAGINGCNIVYTDRGWGKEYFKGHELLCDPGDLDSIKKAVLSAHNAPRQTELARHIGNNYLWEDSLKELLRVYEDIA